MGQVTIVDSRIHSKTYFSLLVTFDYHFESGWFLKSDFSKLQSFIQQTLKFSGKLGQEFVV